MIRAFTYLNEDLKSRGIHPGLHFMENEASTALNLKMTTMNSKNQLVHPSNHRANNAEIAIHTFKNHFIAGLCIINKDFDLQLWYRLLHQANNKSKPAQAIKNPSPHLGLYSHLRII